MENSFQEMKVRHLLGWVVLSTISLFSIWMIMVMLDLPEILLTALSVVFFSLGIYIIPIIWIWRKMNKNDTSILRFFTNDQKVDVSAVIMAIVTLWIFVNGVNFTLHNLWTLLLPNLNVFNQIPEFNIWSYLIGFIITVILAPICEEIIFRGFLLGRLSAKYDLTTGILLSSVIFGVLHGGSFLSFTVFGVILSMVFIKTRSLLVPIIIHMVFNLFQTIIGYPLEQLAGNSFAVIEDSLVFSLTLLTIGIILVVFYFKKNWKLVIGKGFPL